MNFVASLGAGMPVDLARMLDLVVPAAVWRSEIESGEEIEVSPNEFILAAMAGAGDNNLGVRLTAEHRASVLLSTSRHGSDTSLRVDLMDQPFAADTLDPLAALAAHASIDRTDPGYRIAMGTEWGAAQRRRMAAFIGVGEVQWFGRGIVELMGGDEVFEALPGGWATRTDFGQWRLIGFDPDESPGGYDPRSWSPRERAIIDHLGRQFFLDLDNQSVPTTRLPHFTAPYDVYLWRSGELVIESPDGTTRSLGSAGSASEPEPNPNPMAELAALFVEQIEGTALSDVLADSDENPVYWVGEWLLGQQLFDNDTAVRLAGAWLGEHAVANHDATWTNNDGRWTIVGNDNEHDPSAAVRAWLDGGPPLTLFIANLASR